MAHALAVDKGSGVVQAVFVTQGVELLLVIEYVHLLSGDIGRNTVFREAVPVLGGESDIVVAAPDDQHGTVGVGVSVLHDVFAEGGRLLVLGADAVVDNIALIVRAGGELAKARGLDAVGLVKGAGHAVYVEVPAEKQGIEGLVHGTTSFIW